MSDRSEFAAREFQSRMIDVARGLAILLVLVVHIGNVLSNGILGPVSGTVAWVLSFSAVGAAGVGLFFVISGYLLNMLYSKAAFDAKKYWLRRFARIYPSWFFWTAVAIAVTFIPESPVYLGQGFYGEGIRPDSWLNILLLVLHLLFLGALIPTMWNAFVPGGWSIQAEMFNYLLYTFVRRIPFWAVLVGVLILEVLQALVIRFLGGVTTNLNIFYIVQTFMTGPVWFVIGMFLSRRSKREGDSALESALVAAAIGLAVVLGLSGTFVSQATTAGIVALSIGLAYIAVRTGRWLKFAVIGKYSFGIYFAHFLFLPPLGWAAKGLVNRLGDTAALWLSPVIIIGSYALVLGASLLVAKGVFELIERRPIEWARGKRRMRIKKVEQPA